MTTCQLAPLVINDKANFEFKSKTVAEEFLKLNSEAKLKTDETKAETSAVKPN